MTKIIEFRVLVGQHPLILCGRDRGNLTWPPSPRGSEGSPTYTNVLQYVGYALCTLGGLGHARISSCIYRSEGFALTGYDIPGCVDDGAWMLQENSSVVVAVVAHPDFSHFFSKICHF